MHLRVLKQPTFNKNLLCSAIITIQKFSDALVLRLLQYLLDGISFHVTLMLHPTHQQQILHRVTLQQMIHFLRKQLCQRQFTTFDGIKPIYEIGVQVRNVSEYY